MLVNLKAEMARFGVSAADIARAIGRNERATKRRIRGEVEISGDDIRTIRDAFFPNCTLDYLLEEKPVIPLQARLSLRRPFMAVSI